MYHEWMSVKIFWHPLQWTLEAKKNYFVADDDALRKRQCLVGTKSESLHRGLTSRYDFAHVDERRVGDGSDSDTARATNSRDASRARRRRARTAPWRCNCSCSCSARPPASPPWNRKVTPHAILNPRWLLCRWRLKDEG